MVGRAGEVVVVVIASPKRVAVSIAETVCNCAAVDTWKFHGISRAIRELNSAHLQLVIANRL